jgi:hypothetical protein
MSFQTIPLDLSTKAPADCNFEVLSVVEDGGNNKIGTSATVLCSYEENGKPQKPRALQVRVEEATCFPIRAPSSMSSGANPKYSFGMVVKRDSNLHKLVEEIYEGVLVHLVKNAVKLTPTQAISALVSLGGDIKERFAKKKKITDRQKVATEILRELSDEQKTEFDEAVRSEIKNVFVLVKEKQLQSAMLSPSNREDSEDFILNADVYVKGVGADGVPTMETVVKKKVGDEKPVALDAAGAWETVGNTGRVKVFTASTVVLRLKKIFIKNSGDMVSLGFSLSYVTAAVAEEMEYDPDENVYRSKRMKLDPTIVEVKNDTVVDEHETEAEQPEADGEAEVDYD